LLRQLSKAACKGSFVMLKLKGKQAFSIPVQKTFEGRLNNIKVGSSKGLQIKGPATSKDNERT
jgi:hypothetical protein